MSTKKRKNEIKKKKRNKLKIQKSKIKKRVFLIQNINIFQPKEHLGFAMMDLLFINLPILMKRTEANGLRLFQMIFK
jgi:hypothetical protein